MDPSADRKQVAARLTFTVGLWAALACICWLFPSTGDDWLRDALGATIHSPGDLARIVVYRFQNYNSRIGGNVLAYLSGSRPVLRMILRSGILLELIFIASRLTGVRSASGTVMVGAALLSLPREMFREIYPWAAGFFNYVPPVALLLAGMLLLRRAERRGPGGMICAVLAGLCGFAGQLFIETCTVYALLLGVAVIIWDVRQGRVSPAAVLYLLGTAAGAVLLFSSPVYRSVSSADYAYHTEVFHGIEAMTAMAKDHIPEILDSLFLHSPVLILSNTAVYTICFFGRAERRTLDWCVLVVFLASCLVLLTGMLAPLSELMLRCAAVVWYAALLWGSARWIMTAELRRKVVFLELSAAAVAAPLLFVEPVGPRCLYASYVFLILGAVCGLRETATVRWPSVVRRIPACVAAIAVLSFYGRIYLPVHQTELLQRELVQTAKAQGAAQVVLPAFPNAEYLWDARNVDKMEHVYCYHTPGDLKVIIEE